MQSDFLYEVRSFFVLVVIAFGLGVFIFFASAFLSPSTPNLEKISAYECGFEPFDDARARFDVRFYLVALLFIIFDLEVAFLFPTVVSSLGGTGLLTFFVFLFVLTAGFVYEWSQGALQWS